MNHEFAGGVNRIVYHVRPYIDSPASSWPGLGFSTAKVSFSNAWNRIRAVLGRRGGDQRLLRPQPHGPRPRARRRPTSPSTCATTRLRRPSRPPTRTTGTGWTSASSAPATRGTTSTSTLVPPAERGRHQQPPRRERPGIQGADLRPVPLPDIEHGARRTDDRGRPEDPGLRHRPGLPVIFVGTPDRNGRAAGLGRRARCSAIVAQILAQPSVSQVASEADVPAKLAAARHPRRPAKPAAPTSLQSVRRYDEATKTDYYWLYNQGVDAYPGIDAATLRQEPVEPLRGADRVPLHRHRASTRAWRPATPSTRS